jgi:hydroxymethylbilane synthase
MAALSEFDQVACAFHEGRPSFAEALDLVGADEYVVVPVMTSEGFYAKQVLPRELARNQTFGRARLVQTPPIGVHPGIAGLVARRVRRLQEGRPQGERDFSLVLVGHGTERDANSRQATEALAASLRGQDLCADVFSVFLDEEPRVESARNRVTQSWVVVIPFLISAGAHAIRDVPRRLGMTVPDHAIPPFEAVLDGRSWVCEGPLGLDSELVELIADSARKGSVSLKGSHAILPMNDSLPRGRATMGRLGTRSSAMALWQARHVSRRLSALGAPVEIVLFETSGDRDLEAPIADLPSDSPFTDDIDLALLDGRIELAVHSLKDLPVRLPEGLEVAAVLPRSDARECLVSFDRRPLSAMAAGGRIGTSSPRRKAQLLALRPDLHPVPIRGAVDKRIEQVLDGRFDAAVLAAAGLERLEKLDFASEYFALEEFVPAPGQGALAVVVRTDDRRMREIVARLDHTPTRRAVRAELEVLRPYERATDWIVAAYARVEKGDVVLHARFLSPDGRIVFDAFETHREPDPAAAAALDSFYRFRARGPEVRPDPADQHEPAQVP